MMLQIEKKTYQDSLQPKPTQSDELQNFAVGKRLEKNNTNETDLMISTDFGAVRGINPVKAGKTGIIPRSVIR